MTTRHRGLAGLAVAALFLSGCQTESPAPDWQRLFGYSPDAIHAIEIREFGYPFVPVVVANEDLWLPFDTGNMVGLTLESDEFRRLALPCDDESTRRDSGGQAVSTDCIANDVAVSAFGASWEALRVYEFSHDVLPGLIGPGTLPGTRFTIDYERRLLAVDDKSGPDEVPGFVSLPLVRSERHPRLILVHGTIEGGKILIEIDTGKSRSTVDRRLVEQLGLDTTPNGAYVGAVTLGPRTEVIESARIADTSGVSVGLPLPISLGIGSDTLNQYVWTVDYAAGRLWIESPE